MSIAVVTLRIIQVLRVPLALFLPPLLFGAAARSEAQPVVVVYERAGFDGRAKTLVSGNNSLSASDAPVASLRVPRGLVAVLYEHADDAGGYGRSVDLLEDCADLAAFDFSGKVALVTVFGATKPGYVWARNSLHNGEFVAGHWERVRAGGNPVSTVAVVSPPLPARGHANQPVITPLDAVAVDVGDLTTSPPASDADIAEFALVRDGQYGVGVLGGDTTKPFYYHHNQPDETVYKYKKIVDTQYFDGYALDAIWHHLGPFHAVAIPLEQLGDLALAIQHAAIDIWETITSTHHSTLRAVDTWYPDSEFRTTVAGIMEEGATVCGQDYMHTKVIVDKDMNFDVIPNDSFKSKLKNRWAGDNFTKVEGEVKATNIQELNTHTAWVSETLIPKNPLLREGAVRKGDLVGLYGPWMADILDINGKVPVPLSNDKFEVANIDIRNNDEIHPINQMWIKRGNETELIAVVDRTGYFDKQNAMESQASAFNQRMRFYLAFEIPASGTPVQEYQVNGLGYDFQAHPIEGVEANAIALKYKGAVCLKIADNGFIKLQKTHRVFFEKTRLRPDGSVQGYIVVETEPINVHGGSINVFVTKVQ